jgi:hypothetical protein
MKPKLLASFLLFFINIFAFEIAQVPEPRADQPVPSLEVVQEELTQAEKDFEIAKKMFNPWYGGPLITGSGATLPKGLVNVQPYLYVTVDYAEFDENRKSKSIKNFIRINPKLGLAVGITDRLDMGILVNWTHQKQAGKSSKHFGDTELSLDIGIIKETPFLPGIKFSISEIFPTGRYQKLDPTKAAVESTGAGSYQTTLSLTTSKVIWYWLTHPMNFRFSFNYIIPAKVSVSGFNSYGGGFGTKGKVDVGNAFFLSFGWEFSVYQKLVIALDIAYEYQNQSTFKGINGLTFLGTIAPVGSRSQDVLSLAPALEYNFSQNLSLIGGAWFSVWGRNTSDFASGIITLTYTF